jgi:hypothetical protein
VLEAVRRGETSELEGMAFDVEVMSVRDVETGESLPVVEGAPGEPPTVVDDRAADAPFTATFIGTKDP